MTPDTCGCCELPEPLTPIEIDNRPGLSAIAYRVRTFSSFRQAMLQTIASVPELAGLRTRLSDDYAITILELWAIVADILTFYQERIANEGYLRTATLRDSIVRLTRLLDYQLRPGVAATAYLAFTVEKGKQVEVPVGLRVQSVPGQNEKPQKFETLEPIKADARFNQLRIYPEPVPINPLKKDKTETFLMPGAASLAVAASLAPGDRVVLFNPGTQDLVEELTVRAIKTDADQVFLTWSTSIYQSTWNKNSQALQFRRILRLFGYNAPSTYLEPVTDITNKITGWNQKKTEYKSSNLNTLFLEGCFDDIKQGTKLLISASDQNKIETTVIAVHQSQVSIGPLTDTVTQLTIEPKLEKEFDIRSTLIYELKEGQICFRNYEYSESLTTSSIYLPGQILDQETIEVSQTIAKFLYQSGLKINLKEIEINRRVLLTDSHHSPVTAIISGASIVDHIESIGKIKPHLKLDLKLDLAPKTTLNLQTASAMLLGNVALASHGETVKGEIVGDGDTSEKFQQFALQKQPLTYVSSAIPDGLQSSLKVLVNQVLWQEVPSLYGRSPADPVYTTRMTDDGTTILQFGDGRTGARLPSGRSNILAQYRQGSGLAGRVKDNVLTTLLDRPVGLKSVTNPLAADGGADPETLDQARRKAPTTVRTFSRAVSLRDFEDLAMASGEVAKAKATWVWYGASQAVHLTVAGQQGALFSPAALNRIHDGFTGQRDPNSVLLLDNFIQVPIVIQATLWIADNRVTPEVLSTAQTTLLQFLSFESLQFGQSIHLSHLYQVLQSVEGVVSVDIDRLQFKQQTPDYLTARGATADPVQGHLRIYPARTLPPPHALPYAIVLPAEQACIEVPTQDITLLTSGGLPG